MVSRETGVLSLRSFFQKRSSFFGAAFPDGFFNRLSFDSLSVLTLWLKYLSSQNPCLVVCPDADEAEVLYRAAYLFGPVSTFYFPDDHVFPASVPGFVSEHKRYREEALRAVKTCSFGLFFSSKESSIEPCVPIIKNEDSHLLIQGGAVDVQRLIDNLSVWGYTRVDKTMSPNTFSVRGGIVDVFLRESRHPLRIELFGSTIDSLRAYNPVSQRRVSDIKQIEVFPPSDYYHDKAQHTTLTEALPKNTLVISISRKNNSWVTILENRETNSETADISSSPIVDFAGDLPTDDMIVFLENESQIQIIKKKLSQNVLFVSGVLQQSFQLCSVLFLSANDFLKQTPSSRLRWETDYVVQQPLSSLLSLAEGDYLVHREYGIGRYQGLSVLRSKAGLQECIKIEYGNGAAVHVPLDKFDRVHRYVGKEKQSVVLSTLGSPKWKNEKKRVVDAATDVVRSLVRLYQSRNSSRGFLYEKNDFIYRSIAESFPYEETLDQDKAISSVTSDMETNRPMDRLVCGDVGFGKTEVAIRAATKAVISGKKVLVLTPTTILADQHYITFKNRLNAVGIRTELLSRFRTKAQQSVILEKMMTDQLDIVIGTHRLLSSDVQFPNLGLIIIDEEHRFGVRHKERLRELKTSLDVLTLTATPIPRTLQQSLIGVRDLSTINTPPKTRKPIHTTVSYFHWDVVEKAIGAELLRNGQIYFLHNDIQSLPFYFEELQNRFPGAVVAIAHGQMSSRNLEETVLAFFSGKINILLCTTIIESGLDVANANTIIINQAQNFGLSQLYQIRGRVGRGYRQAHCHLMIPKHKTLSADAYQRLKALEHYTSLGSGYNIALRDLEIRGAGNLFGTKQSGHMAKVGFELYCKLLEEAAEEQAGVKKEKKLIPTITVYKEALLGEDYVPLVQDRLYFYLQLSSCESLASLDDIYDELRDRFGPLPPVAALLVETTKLRIQLTGSSASSVSIKTDELIVVLRDISPFETFSDLTTSLSNALVTTLCTYQFKQLKPDMVQIVVSTPSFKKSLAVSKEFVKLFSVLECK